MGTVGLSFGSPTSGTGFDVSTTVSSIVANLQNVETPWKTQLTSLESQDTAISSLGTLFSNLSNDLSALTDFEGIMAEKTGSVSDENVVAITAADNTAIAGTHTLEVTNLAQTSSGYLAPVSSASATLTGSVTLQVGGGKAQIIKVPTTSGENTLAGLAAAINASGVGINASVLTDSSGSRLSLVSGTSGANGNITVTSNIAASNTTLSYTGSAGTSKTASTGTLTPITNAGDTLSGTISIQVGSGTKQTITVGTSTNTLATLAAAITSAGIGVTASVVTNSDGSSSLSLLSGTTGSAGTLTVSSNIVDTSDSLGYTSTTTGSDANLTVDGVNLTSASNTVANLIPGVTFQLLAPSSSGEQVQVVIANDNSVVESTVNSMVSDYNSLISAVNAQEGKDSSGNNEPLFGSPTLSLLQQQLLGGLNMQNPNGYLDSVTSSTDTLSGSLQVAVGSGVTKTVVIGAAPSAADGGPVANTIYTGTGSGYNTIAGVAAAINAANVGMSYSDTGYSSGGLDSGTVGSVVNAGDTLTGAISITVGGGTAQTFTLDSSDNTLQGLADSINGTSGIGVSASVVTNSDGTSSLALAVTTGVDLSYADAGYTSANLDSGTVGSVGSSGATLAGSLSIAVGSGTAKTFTLDSSDNTLTTLAKAINTASIGVTASVITNSDGTSSLSLVSQTSGTDGALTVTSSIINGALAVSSSISDGIGLSANVLTNSSGSQLALVSDTAGSNGALTVKSSLTDATTSTALGYNSGGTDINSITSLGISVNNDGSLTFSAASLDSVLNTDYGSVVGFFQNSDSWGQTFSTMLTDSGTSSTKGILSLASTSNSNIESTLNADISKEELIISKQQVSLTAELNSANEIMQEIPSQLNSVNELYSAITGYSSSSNG
jgi:flagellar hook-associated protein 2